MNLKEKIARHLFGGLRNKSFVKAVRSGRFLLLAALFVSLAVFIYFPGILVGALGMILDIQNINDALFSGVFTFASYHNCVPCTSPANNLGQTNSGSACSPTACTATAPADATLSFAADPSGNQPNGTSVTYTATSSVDVSPTIYYIRIYEGTTQLKSCGTGPSCAYATSGTSQTRTFTAKVENYGATSIPLTSSPISTTWAASDATPPTVGVSGAPGSWQNTNATASITCDDGTGVGCESSGNWKFMTPTTSPGASCSTTLSDYTGVYSGAFLIQEHRWMCATAADTNGNRRYTSSPVEFKVDKTSPSAPTSISYSPNPDVTGTPTVSWSGAADTGDSGIASYDVRRSSDGGSNWTTVRTGNTTTSWQQSPVVGSGTYRYQVKTKDTATNESSWSTNTNSISVNICDSSSYAACSTAKDFGSSGSQGAMCGTDQYYKLTVSSGQVCDITWTMTPQIGVDYDLYSRISSSCPTTATYDCRPYSGVGTQEICSHSGVGAGTYTAYVKKYGGAGSYSITAGSSCKTITQLPDANFSFDPTSIITGGSTTVRGWLKDTAATPAGIGGRTVALQCWNGSSWPQVASGTTETAAPNVGYTSFSWTPATGWGGNVSCRLNFAGDSSYLASTSGQKVLAIGEPTLTYPSGTWQRLWYTTSGASPSFSTGNFKGEDTVGSINIAKTGGTIVTLGGTSYSNNIGFKASRTINFPTAGLYRFTLNSDDGSRLYVDKNPTPAINQWYDGGDNTLSANVEISPAGDHTFQIDYYENGTDAKLSFSYELLPTAPAPSGVNTDPSDTAIDVSWNSISGVSSATYRLEWCKKSVIDAGGSFSSATCGPPNSPVGGPPYFLTTTTTSGYIIGTEPATTYSLRVRVDSGTSASYVFPGTWASASATTKTPVNCSNVDPTNTSSGSSVTNDCFQVERRCSATDTGDGCSAACFLGNKYLSSGLNPITKIGTVATGKWKVTGSASYDLFAQGHGIECIGADWESWIYKVDASVYLKYPSPLDTIYSSQDLNWSVDGEGGQEFSLPGAAALTFDKVFECSDTSCDLWFYSTFSGNTWTHKQFFPGGSGDYVRQLAVMDTNFSWVRVDETAPGVPTINTAQDQWRKENPVTNMTVTDDIALSGIGYALKGKDCNFPADPCSEADWKKAQKSDLSGDLAVSGTSATADWKISNVDWGRFDQGSNTLYLRVKDAAGNCRGCDDGTKIQFGVKKDSLAPTVSVTNIRRTSPSDQVQDLGAPTSSTWLKAGIYEVSLSIEDPGVAASTGSNIDTTYRPVTIRSKGVDNIWETADDRTFPLVRGSDNKFYVWVGLSSNSFNDCVDEGLHAGEGRCRAEVSARDIVGNNVNPLDAGRIPLKIDFTPPTAQ